MTPDTLSMRNTKRRADAETHDFSGAHADPALPHGKDMPLSTQTIVRWHDLSRRLLDLGLPRLSRMIEHLIRLVYSARIPAEAEIDRSVHFSHNALSVVITKMARIGPRCQIGMHVVLGSRWPLNGGPVLEEDVIVHAGAKVIGPVLVGRGSVIGANAVVLHDVPAHTLVAGVPAVVKKTEIRIEDYRVPPGTFD